MAVAFSSRGANFGFLTCFTVFLSSIVFISNGLSIPVTVSVDNFTFTARFAVFNDDFKHCIVLPCASVYRTSPVLLWARLPGCLPFRPLPHRSLLSCFIAFLLLTVESNPGPSFVRFGSLNAGSATSKCALIADLIRDNKLDVLAVCESWVADDAPDAIKHDLAPPNYSVLHVHRPMINGRRRRGGGLAFIYSNELGARPLKMS